MLGFLSDMLGGLVIVGFGTGCIAFMSRRKPVQKWYPNTIVKGPRLHWTAKVWLILLVGLFGLLPTIPVVQMIYDFAQMSTSYAYKYCNLADDPNDRLYYMYSWQDHKEWWRKGVDWRNLP